MLVVVPILSLAILFNVVFNIWLYFHQPDPRYFASADGKLTPIAPVSVPYQKDADVVQWAADAVRNIYAYDFSNYRQQFENNRTYFTDRGYENFTKAIEGNRLPMVTSKMLVSTAVITGTPVIVSKGVANGTFLWKIQVPISVTLSNNSQRSTGNYVVNLIAARVQTYENPFGVAISQFNESPL